MGLLIANKQGIDILGTLNYVLNLNIAIKICDGWGLQYAKSIHFMSYYCYLREILEDTNTIPY